MKKRIRCVLFVVITLLSCCISANAAVPETPSPMFVSTVSCTPKLVFIGSDALCKLQVYAKQSTASIRAYVRLYDEDDHCVNSWALTGTGRLIWETYQTVSSGTYTLTVSVQVYHPSTGSDYITKSYTATL